MSGLGNSVAVGAEGEPFFSYLIVPAELEPGEIPATRPIGAPFIQTETTPAEGDQPAKPGKFGAAIGVGSVSADGIFTRGAAAQVRDTPTGITIPYGPATVNQWSVAPLENMNGTDIAVDAAGGKHVVWTGADGVYYGLGGQTRSRSSRSTSTGSGCARPDPSVVRTWRSTPTTTRGCRTRSMRRASVSGRDRFSRRVDH